MSKDKDSKPTGDSRVADLIAALRNIECNAYHETVVRNVARDAIDKATKDNNR